MIKKAENTQTSLMLDIILQETRKHRELLKHLGVIYEGNSTASGKDCEWMGEWFKESLTLTHTVKDEVERGMRIPEAASRLIDFEKFVGEEYLTAMQVKFRALVQQDQAVKMVLESIAADEKGHAEILQLVAKNDSKK